MIEYVIILCPNYDIYYYRFCRYSGICEKTKQSKKKLTLKVGLRKKALKLVLKIRFI